MRKNLLKSIRKIMVTAVALTLVTGLFGCGSQKKDDVKISDSGVELKKVVIAVPGNDGTMMENALIAQTQGYFEEELEKAGYYPEYEGFPQAGPAVNEAFASGKIDFAVYGDFPAITAKSNGVDIKVLAITNRAYNHGLLVSEKSDIKSLADLKGKKVVIPLGTVHYKWFQTELAKEGIDVSEVETINSVQDGPSMLQTGDADAIITAYQGTAYYQAAGYGKIVDDSKDDIEKAAEFVLAGRTAFVDENENAAVALIKALNRAYEYSQENPYDDVISKLVTASNNESVLKTIYDEGFSYFNPVITDNDIKRLADTIKYMKDSKLIAGDVDVNEFVNTTYIEKALN